MSVHFGSLTQPLVHPTVPVLLTKNGPLGITIRCAASLKQVTHLTHNTFMGVDLQGCSDELQILGPDSVMAMVTVGVYVCISAS